MTDNEIIAEKLMVELRKCEVDVHMKTLKGGYADIIVIGQEIYVNLLPEIKDKLNELYGHKLVSKRNMYNPMIRYIWFGDNEHFVNNEHLDEMNLSPAYNSEIKIKLSFDEPIKDEERTLELKREYLSEDCDNEIIKKLLNG